MWFGMAREWDTSYKIPHFRAIFGGFQRLREIGLVRQGNRIINNTTILP